MLYSERPPPVFAYGYGVMAEGQSRELLLTTGYKAREFCFVFGGVLVIFRYRVIGWRRKAVGNQVESGVYGRF